VLVFGGIVEIFLIFFSVVGSIEEVLRLRKAAKSG